MAEVLNETVDGKYRLIEYAELFGVSYRLEDEDGNTQPLWKIDYLDWKKDEFGELVDESGSLREVDDDGRVISRDVQRHWSEDEADYYRDVI